MARWCVCNHNLVPLWACLAVFIPTQRCDVITRPLKCDPGFVRVNATAAACSPCPDGKYMDTWNEYLSCHQCSTCTFPSRTIAECNSTHDTVCECHDGYYMSVDGCTKMTLDHNPVMNLTTSVQRIEEILGGLQTSLNETHSDVIRKISGELRKLNETFFSVLHSRGTPASKHATCETAKLSNATTDIAEVIQRTNITTIMKDISEHQSRIWTNLSECNHILEYLVIGSLAFVIIVLLVCEIWKEKIYDSFCGLQCCRKESGCSNGLFNCKGYMPLDIKVSKGIAQIKDEICGQDLDHTSLEQMVAKLKTLTTASNREANVQQDAVEMLPRVQDHVKKLHNAIFVEEISQDDSSIQSLIDKVIEEAEVDASLTKKEQVMDTAKNIKERIFGADTSGDFATGPAAMKKLLQNIFEGAQKQLHDKILPKATKISIKVSGLQNLTNASAEYKRKVPKIQRNLIKLGRRLEVKVVEATIRLYYRLSGRSPDPVPLSAPVFTTLNQLSQGQVTEVTQEVSKILKALRDGGDGEWKSTPVVKLLWELNRHATAMPNIKNEQSKLMKVFYGNEQAPGVISHLLEIKAALSEAKQKLEDLETGQSNFKKAVYRNDPIIEEDPNETSIWHMLSDVYEDRIHAADKQDIKRKLDTILQSSDSAADRQDIKRKLDTILQISDSGVMGHLSEIKATLSETKQKLEELETGQSKIKKVVYGKDPNTEVDPNENLIRHMLKDFSEDWKRVRTFDNAASCCELRTFRDGLAGLKSSTVEANTAPGATSDETSNPASQVRKKENIPVPVAPYPNDAPTNSNEVLSHSENDAPTNSNTIIQSMTT